jgi:hypothetical protein
MASVGAVSKTIYAWFDLDLATPKDELATDSYSRNALHSTWRCCFTLMSEAFDLGSARLLDSDAVFWKKVILSEQVIDHEKAKALMPRGLLGDTDPFWIRLALCRRKAGCCNDSCAASIGTHSVRCRCTQKGLAYLQKRGFCWINRCRPTQICH